MKSPVLSEAGHTPGRCEVSEAVRGSREEIRRLQQRHQGGSQVLNLGLRVMTTTSSVSATLREIAAEQLRIITRYDPPSIPVRGYDWSAVLDGYDGADGGDPVGYGPTEQAAIDDLKERLEYRRTK